METLASPGLDREALAARYRANRLRTAGLFALIAPEAYEDAPLPLRHPFVFYDGHIAAFSFFTLVRDALGQSSIDAELERLFNRGIDPRNAATAAGQRRTGWPSRDTIAQFAARCDTAVLDALANGRLEDPLNPRLVRAQAVFNILEHEEMHQETLLYIIHRLTRERQRGPRLPNRDVIPPPREPVAIPAGRATLGADRDAVVFGWDNEFERFEVAVPAFRIDAYDVTNGDWLAFANAGGPIPPNWFRRDGEWMLHGVFEDLPLPRSWPVYCSQSDAAAFCAWSGARLPTEAEYHRAAFGTPSGDERSFPWGGAVPDPSRHGNFGWRRFDPEPVGSSPHGASAWGVQDLVGNGWEWTATPFGPHPGFEPMASYPPYSIDFFDGNHYVLKGASPVTSAALVRRTFRNWFYADYPYVHATFRRAYD